MGSSAASVAPELTQRRDLTQEFFVRVLEGRYLNRADPNKGRFRAFILTSLKFFLADEDDRGRAQKRGGGTVLSLEFSSGEERYRREPAHKETPELIFDRRWALSVLDRVMDRLRDEFVQHGRLDHFNRLKAFLLDQAKTPYAALAREMGTSEGALKVAVHRLRKRYRGMVPVSRDFRRYEFFQNSKLKTEQQRDAGSLDESRRWAYRSGRSAGRTLNLQKPEFRLSVAPSRFVVLIELPPWTYNGHQGDHMRISTVREFRDKATGLLRSKTPILVTRRGRLAGIFFPRPEITLPIELKRELYDMLSSDVARQLKRRNVSEDDVLEDFEASRKRRRATRRRR